MIQLYEHQLFITSCYTTYLDGYDHKRLIDNIYNLQNTEPGNTRSNKGGWQSNAIESTNFDNDIMKKLNSPQYLRQRVSQSQSVGKENLNPKG